MEPEKITPARLEAMKKDGNKIACLTAYDASFAALLDAAGVEVLLIGDSLGMVLHGHDNTIGVTMENMCYHVKQVASGAQRALLIGDLPYRSYLDPETALGNAKRLLESGADVIKLERGDQDVVEITRRLADHAFTVCGHLGLTPQSIKSRGDYKMQGTTATAAARIQRQARDLRDAGAAMLVLECVPASLAAAVTADLKIPVIGIGAGKACDGQVLVVYDLLGLSIWQPCFSKNFLEHNTSIKEAVQAYVKAVKVGEFPAPKHYSA